MEKSHMPEIRQKVGTPGSPRTCEDRGLFVALELVGANYDSVPSHCPFWAIKEKQQSDLYGFNYRLCLYPFFKGEGHAWFPIVFRHSPTKL